jgi:hypothetical protein
MELEAPDSSETACHSGGNQEETMRHSLFGALLGASLVIAVGAGRGSSEPAYAPQIDAPTRAASNSELTTYVNATGDGQPLTVTVIDTRQRVMAVYHVDRGTGVITPKSVRNITWDLQMIEFNSGNPLPQDIRNGLKR